MRSKAPLTLIELCIMVLIFAFAAALCMKGFVWSELKAESNTAADNAAVCIQNAAEMVKYTKGECISSEGYPKYYDIDWNECSGEDAVFTLSAAPQNASAGLGKSELTITDANGETVISVNVAWQEEM